MTACGGVGLRERVAGQLAAGRERSLRLLEPVSEADLRAQHSPLMSPLVWDLAHVGSYEELWLLREAAGREPVRPDIDDLYDAFRHARRDRSRLPILGPAQARAYVADVRERVLDSLDGLPADRLAPAGGPSPLLADAFVYGMVVQHEAQHDETMLATLQLRQGPPVLVPETVLPCGRRHGPRDVVVPAGPFVLGVDAADEPWSYDNERGAHVVDLPAFRIARLPVTNAEWTAFTADGGYDRPELWTGVGWAHRREAGLRAPMSWRPDGAGGWLRTRFGRVEPVPPDEPVQHVCFHEARAYARWAGARLPTEAEWEKACAWDPAAGRRRRWPWGDAPPDATRANLGGGAHRPAPVGAYPAGASAYGVEQMLGDVWEWCDSGFTAYPGFRAFPYREYSEVFFGGDFRMLRGGSWATATEAVRPSFRNWDLPVRRQVFTGLRLARDV